MTNKTLGVLAAALVVALTGCTAPVSATTSTPPIQITEQPRDHASHSESGHGHGHGQDHGVPAVTWGPSTYADVTAMATDLMMKFARPEVTERAWFDALQPHMSADYQDSAQYIDPARIPLRTILSGPVLVREQGNPMSVLAEFSTNDGPWVLSLHRSGQEQPWLITRIAPKDS